LAIKALQIVCTTSNTHAHALTPSYPHPLLHTHTHTHTSSRTWVVCVSEPLHEPINLSHDGVQTSHLHLHGPRCNVNNANTHWYEYTYTCTVRVREFKQLPRQPKRVQCYCGLLLSWS